MLDSVSEVNIDAFERDFVEILFVGSDKKAEAEFFSFAFGGSFCFFEEA